MIIKDVNGDKLSLTKTTLEEVTGMIGGPDSFQSWIILSELRDKITAQPHETNGVVQLYCPTCPNNKCMDVDYDLTLFVIGCRVFSPETFAKILNAAGVKPVRKPAKKGKK
jgi:hypothetical protein